MNNPIKLSFLDHTKPQEGAAYRDVLLQHPQHRFRLSSQKNKEFELHSQEHFLCSRLKEQTACTSKIPSIH